ncbi:MAG TPA: hypothetical protein VNQ73_21345 [Ilumatobacter sp.]|nr:hypothetical protein [Ilumatobacter sp.]
MIAGGCGGESDQARPLTADEAALLASTRVQNVREREVGFEIDIPGSPRLLLDVVVNFEEHYAYGRFESRERGDEGPVLEHGLIGWDPNHVVGVAADDAQVPIRDHWFRQALGSESRRDLTMLLTLNLGSDRPENPQLLQQGSAQFLRRDRIGDTAVIVLAGPGDPSSSAPGGGARTRYWLDDQGTMLRFEAYLGDAGGKMTTVDRSDAVIVDDALHAAVREALNLAP